MRLAREWRDALVGRDEKPRLALPIVKQPIQLRHRHCERQRSNPWCRERESWIASSQVLLAMTIVSPSTLHQRVVPANAGTHNHRSRLHEEARPQLGTTRAFVVMGPGSRPGRQWKVRFNFQTADTTLRSQTTCVPSRCNSCPSKSKRARGMPGAQCTRSPVCAIGSKYAHGYSQRRHRIHPAFPTQWFYGLFRALPGDRAFLPPSFAG